MEFKKWFCRVLIGFALTPTIAYANNVIKLTSKSQTNKLVITKKPTIICSDKDIDYKNITAILLDETDITELSDISNDSITFDAFVPLASGEHTLSVIYSENGEDKRKDFVFRTKQSKYFDTATAKFSATTLYVSTLKKSDKLTDVPHTKIESNPEVDVLLENEYWHYSFHGGLKYLSQSLPVEPPQQKGFDLSGYLLSIGYKNEDFSADANIGDIQIDESDYSAQGLSGRGGVLSTSYKSYAIRAFVVDSKSRYGFDGGTGLDIGSKNSIYGASFTKTFFDDTNIRLIYLHGKKTGDGFGTSSSDPQTITKEGYVYALSLSTPIIKDKISLYSEIDFSSYDPNISDSFDSMSDRAYNVKLNITPNEIYNFNVVYEHVGRKYFSIANEGITNDTEGVYFNAGANYTYHTIALKLSRSNNNVDDIPLYSKIYTYSGEVDYSLNRFEHAPINLSYRRDYVKSTKEPSEDDKQKMITDTYHGDIGYNMDSFSILFGVDYSKQNDKTKNNQDTSSVTYSLSPSYSVETFHINPNLSFNKTRDYKSGTNTNATTLGLALGGSLFKQRFSYDLSGTYTKTKDNKNTTNTRGLNAAFQVAYAFELPKNWVVKTPSIGIRGEYNHSRDKISGTKDHDINIQLFVSIPLEYIF
ncbi:hypothetical protein [Hippea maritima]|uniref:Outer membrane protein beta-barrel domain-containing protein n=1 Tax=Hippea maritima (strain ATCC 700847 / DSM 10411 / MH2) TaxID=760142 RepID=F2LWI2_HIPMA|nr:hypothetical protein [Hippea maritima]AEA34091.1 hypothetical protein Hipma_1125 [Hippea maritima DSM 10411]